MSTGFLDELRKIPPVTRFICGSTLAISLPVMLQIVSPYRIVFVKSLVTENFELWRIFTSMFFAGSGLNFLFEFIMLYRNSDGLESSHYTGRSADYAWHLFLTASGILVLNLPLHSFLHFRPLLLSLAYVSSCLSPDGLVSIFGLLTLRHAYFPYALLAMDFIMAGPKSAACSLTGLIAGHAWWYLFCSEARPGESFSHAPGWVKSLVSDGPAGAPQPGTGTVGTAGTGTGGSGGGVRLGGSGPAGRAPSARPAAPQTVNHNWGSGQRLGN